MNQDLIYTLLKPSIQKWWLWRKVQSIFVSEIKSMSILHLICCFPNSNFFLVEFMLKWGNINLFIYLRYHSIYISTFYRKNSGALQQVIHQSYIPQISAWIIFNCQPKTLKISLIKALLKTVNTFLFKWSLPLLRWCDLIFRSSW